MPRKCPRCPDRTLEEIPLAEVTTTRAEVLVDHCRSCSGTYFDHLEAEQAMGTGERLSGLAECQLLERTCPRCTSTIPSPKLTACPACKLALCIDCPACRRPMGLHDIMGVEVDICQGCRGIWLDEGELRELSRKYRTRSGRIRVGRILGMLFGR